TQRLDDVFARVHEEDRDDMRHAFECAVRERTAYIKEFRIVRPDGSVRMLRGLGKAFYDQDGKPLYATGVAIDSHDEKLAEDAVRASEERFFKAFEASPDCIAIVDFGLGGVLAVNEAFERITGYARAEILGRTMKDLGIIDPILRDAAVDRLRTL